VCSFRSPVRELYLPGSKSWASRSGKYYFMYSVSDTDYPDWRRTRIRLSNACVEGIRVILRDRDDPLR